MTAIDSQPVSNIRWVERDELSANSWNPNRQAPPEHRLLKVSIRENGWTQPIVVRQEDHGLEIVDGFHRWTVSQTPDIAELTGGLVPVAVLPPTDPALARLATIRHNRARGVHHVLGMAKIVVELRELGLSAEDLAARLEMDPEEVDRLSDRGGMIERGSAEGYNNGWTV
ncbi:ParB N-terminal domain-containing protein [Actinomadura miaoliensis]|uniref:ParB/RepB/Spo0J family partition protein n=1 Tax=Actinomadura miaoliensis TaxID=430685 RepID=A0ABP7WBC1_9ACTN